VSRIAHRLGVWSRRRVARAIIERNVDLHIEGLEHVPTSGAAILVARHYHHLYDAVAILACVSREVHVVVALDWLGGGLGLRLMRWLADVAEWPVVWRAGKKWRFNRDGYLSSVRLLRDGQLLLLFPEAYPIIDPSGSPRVDSDALLPFDSGFLVIAERARQPVPIVPVGVCYGRSRGGKWRMWLRFGPAVCHGSAERPQRRRRLASIEAEVLRLSLLMST
jgi:1-acyl-sn-glycerol-3-phosphate acyltransferase